MLDSGLLIYKDSFYLKTTYIFPVKNEKKEQIKSPNSSDFLS